MDTAITTAEPVKCRRCKRPLTASARFGIGPRCAAIEAAMEGLKPEQAAKALEVLADGGVVPVGHRGVYRVASTDGTGSYLTAVTGQCNCRHGLKTLTGRPCYHVGAARLAAQPVRRSLAKAA